MCHRSYTDRCCEMTGEVMVTFLRVVREDFRKEVVFGDKEHLMCFNYQESLESGAEIDQG